MSTFTDTRIGIDTEYRYMPCRKRIETVDSTLLYHHVAPRLLGSKAFRRFFYVVVSFMTNSAQRSSEIVKVNVSYLYFSQESRAHRELELN